jgi:predicted acylesterase/phospholipase RssA
MKIIVAQLALVGLSLSVCLNAHAIEKYKTAMVFSGGGLETAMFLGMLEGVEEAGIKPDVLVGSCGGSVAAAIAQVFHTHQERLEFLKSKDFQDFLLLPKPTATAFLPYATKFLLGVQYNWYLTDKIPDVFNNYLLQVPFETNIKEFKNRFAEDGSIPIVFNAAKLDFGPEEVAKGAKFGGRKLYHEVFFTDHRTAPLLEGYKSAIASQFPDSAIHPETQVFLDLTLETAARASMSDPHLMNPMKIGDDYYMTGAVDLQPLEVANAVADQVIMSYDPGFDPVVTLPIMGTTFKYNYNQRVLNVNSSYAAYWIDRSDSLRELDMKVGFMPTLINKHVAQDVPTDRDKFISRIEAQWKWGKARALEGVNLQRPLNDKSHIRERSISRSEAFERLIGFDE